MNNAEKYNELLMEIGASIKAKNETIALQQLTIDSLREKLKAAEAELEEMKSKKEVKNIEYRS